MGDYHVPTATVVEAGAYGGDIHIRISGNWYRVEPHQEGEFREQYFVAEAPGKREMLATALTAMSTGYKVYVETNGIEAYSVIDRIYCLTR